MSPVSEQDRSAASATALVGPGQRQVRSRGPGAAATVEAVVEHEPVDHHPALQRQWQWDVNVDVGHGVRLSLRHRGL